ncbi:glucuronate isomerase [Allomuricauda sp. SCSIO 64092]|uniref:glucuronate isomerase n=1 Tax=Allomuricauda sp. SCSIO 64092 TaxID=2908842 RepID=UPI00391A60B8
MVIITGNFLPKTQLAEELYHRYAKSMSIIDCPSEQIAREYQFKNLAEAWLARDYYKWRTRCSPPIGLVPFVGVGLVKTTIKKVVRSLLPLFLAIVVAFFRLPIFNN